MLTKFMNIPSMINCKRVIQIKKKTNSLFLIFTNDNANSQEWTELGGPLHNSSFSWSSNFFGFIPFSIGMLLELI